MLSLFNSKKAQKPESRASLRRLSQRLRGEQDATADDRSGNQPPNQSSHEKPNGRENGAHRQTFRFKDESDQAGYETVPDQHIGDEPRMESTDGQDVQVTSGPIQPSVVFDRILAVIVHRTDRIKSKTYIIHPMVKVHVVNANTGEYSKKSQRLRAVSYVNEAMPVRADTVDYILPLMTKPSEFRARDLAAPTWEELLLFNDEYDYFVDPSNNIMLMFEVKAFTKRV